LLLPRQLDQAKAEVMSWTLALLLLLASQEQERKLLLLAL
jgi:hypothetical protein